MGPRQCSCTEWGWCYDWLYSRLGWSGKAQRLTACTVLFYSAPYWLAEARLLEPRRLYRPKKASKRMICVSKQPDLLDLTALKALDDFTASRFSGKNLWRRSWPGICGIPPLMRLLSLQASRAGIDGLMATCQPIERRHRPRRRVRVQSCLQWGKLLWIRG